MTIRGDYQRLVMVVKSVRPWRKRQPQSSSLSRRNLSCLVCSKFQNEDSENGSWSVGCRCLCAWVWRGLSKRFVLDKDRKTRTQKTRKK